MTIEALQNLLSSFALKANKTYGQHFLLDEYVLQDMVDIAGVTKEDTVLEVGPGIGNLTRALLEKAGQVIAIEKDPQFLSLLNRIKKEHKNFSYVENDVLQQSLVELIPQNKPYKVVANIPYYVTGKIIQHFLAAEHKPISMTLLMQKEVAENLTASVGQLNLLGISVQLYADVKFVQVVRKDQFYPAPKIDSAVVHIVLHDKPKYKIGDEKKLFRVLKACFKGKRKQVHNTLTNNLQLDKNVVIQVLQECNIKPETRPQALTIDQWLMLVDKI